MFDVENGDSYNRPFLSAGFVQRIALDRRAHLRWELRADQTLGSDGADGNTITSLQGLVGITWGFGRPREPLKLDCKEAPIHESSD